MLIKIKLPNHQANTIMISFGLFLMGNLEKLENVYLFMLICCSSFDLNCTFIQDFKFNFFFLLDEHYTACASLNASATTAFWCPLYSRTTSPWSRFQRRAMLSDEAEKDKMNDQIKN